MRNGGGMHGFVAPTACGINDASQNESSVRSLCHILQPFMAQCRSSPNMYLIKLDGAPPDLLVASEMMMVTGGALSPCHLPPIAKNKKLPRSRISFAPVLCTACSKVVLFDTQNIDALLMARENVELLCMYHPQLNAFMLQLYAVLALLWRI
ncbi:hypothetical protein VTP01DRAFT_28 [Rhizomucor pusillus]|uniref:uncharacterized protein n=1 Tax=Rhizomucor pusillus TaxID=4840 RepID=UPI0037443518